LKPC